MATLKTKYIWYWLKDQLSHPGWFERLFVHRTAWGAFTVYSHLRRTDNKEKIGYKTREDAQQAADSMKKKYGAEFVVYKCLYCDDWHVSKDVRATEAKRNAAEAKALKQFSVKESERSDSLDVELILSTKIPDLAPVYGGFRGRTLSSQRQLPVWSKMVEGGIRQVIDLRADYKSSFYQDLCKKGGVGYFHYPVAYEEERIARMAELFPELCRLIDEGRFYIASYRHRPLFLLDVLCGRQGYGSASPQRISENERNEYGQDYEGAECTIQILDREEWDISDSRRCI